MEEALKELYTVNIDHLTPEGKRLYKAIMKIADDRDVLITNIKVLLAELKYNQKINLEKGLENRADIDYIIKRLGDMIQ